LEAQQKTTLLASLYFVTAFENASKCPRKTFRRTQESGLYIKAAHVTAYQIISGNLRPQYLPLLIVSPSIAPLIISKLHDIRPSIFILQSVSTRMNLRRHDACENVKKLVEASHGQLSSRR
jgi:hypothetical protein